MKQLSLYFTAPWATEIREQPIPEPGPGQLLIATRQSAISAGTELLVFKGLFPEQMALDMNLPALSGCFQYPLRYGYSCVGEVAAIGADVDPAWLGRLVFAFNPHESHFLAGPEALLPVPKGVRPEDALFLAGMETAINLVMDGRPLIGERVMVWGLGIIGLLTSALLARYPLALLVGVDRLAGRRKAALELGAHLAMAGEGASAAVAAALAAPPLGDGRADLIFELSGDPQALCGALSWAGFDTRIIIGSWYGTRTMNIDLGGHFHRQRIKIFSSQVSTLEPELTGRWSKARRLQMAWHMIEALRPAQWISHRHDIRQAQSAYEQLARAPQEVLQTVLTYPVHDGRA